MYIRINCKYNIVKVKIFSVIFANSYYVYYVLVTKQTYKSHDMKAINVCLIDCQLFIFCKHYWLPYISICER